MEFKSRAFFCPAVTDGFIGREAFQFLEPLGEIVGCNEVSHVASKLVMGFEIKTLGVNELFNGKLYDECLNTKLYYNLCEAQIIIERWRHDATRSARTRRSAAAPGARDQLAGRSGLRNLEAAAAGNRERSHVCAEHGMPVALRSQRSAAQEHAVWLFQPLELGRPAGSHSSRALSEVSRSHGS
jgi:hypothetical protein